MHDLYIGKIYRPGTILLPLIEWLYLYSLLYSELWKKLQHKVLHYGRSKIITASPYATSF